MLRFSTYGIPGASLVAFIITVSVGVIPAAAHSEANSLLSFPEVTRIVEAAGYTHVHDLEYDDGEYEADAISPAGVPVDLHIDPRDGRILREERDS
ncbi:MAG: PepSY domain-containing protein [Deltaproteobacteria bacterium]|nr:PepSY domain-containing protein [Deltaproteobacteria bacterium]